MDGNMFNEAMMSALSGLSYFTPLMCSNTSDSNATKKLLQLRQLGVNTIADPLERRVRINGETPGSDVPQYVCEAFKQAAAVMVAILGLPDNEEKGERGYKRFRAIMYHWQVGERSEDLPSGNLVFSDMTTKRFIVIEATGSCNHVAAHRAHELFCLATYLGMDPKWVRSWAWVGNPLPQDLLREGPAPAGVTQVEAGSFHPSLTGVMLKAVDDYVSSHPAIVEVVDREREEAGATQEALRRKVLQPDGAAPVDPCSVRAAQQPRGGSTSSNNQEQQRRQQQQQEHLQPQLGCSSCGKVKGDGVQLRSCTGCGGMAKYCSVECQRLDWPAHKTDCKAARGRVTQQARA